MLSIQVVGLVKDATTGEGLEGAQIAILSRATNNAEYGDGRPTLVVERRREPAGVPTGVSNNASRGPTSNNNGEFAFELEELDRNIVRYRPVWELVITKDGYQSETIDISPPRNRVWDSGTVIRIIAYLRLVRT
jgi:hypothetical protein